MARDLTKRTLIQSGIVLPSKNPSEEYYPAYELVIVVLWPEASRPIAQIYLAEAPKFCSKAEAAVYKVNPFVPGFLVEYVPKVAMTLVLTQYEMNNDNAHSILL